MLKGTPAGTHKCRSCGERKPNAEFTASKDGRVCDTCIALRQPPAAIPLGNGMSAIPLSGKRAEGCYALIDSEDAGIAAGYHWGLSGKYVRAHIPGSGRTNATGRTIYLHTLITGWSRVDHEDGDPLNNTRKNLRKATSAQNMRNQAKRAGCSSQYKGVSSIYSGTWIASVTVNYQTRFWRLFKDEIEAARAYDAAAEELHGEFARTNVDLGLLPPLT